MSLKINYLDRKKSSSKNKAIFIDQNIKIADFKGEFDQKIINKIINLIKQNNNPKKDKIFSLNQDFYEKIIFIFISKSNTELEFEKLGAEFFDYLKKNQINDIHIMSPKLRRFKNNNLFLTSFIHGSQLKSYEFVLYKTKKTKKSASPGPPGHGLEPSGNSKN